jgi:asparagine synthase (glutamine-hydrolysing)
MRSVVKRDDRQALLPAGRESLVDLFHARSRRFAHLDAVAEASRLDLAYYLPDDILQKVDVASMAFSLEARVPLLDHRVVEFALSLPTHFKIRDGQHKWLLRKLLEKRVPRTLFDRPKSGFGVPLREWFRVELKDMVQDELSVDGIKRLDGLNPEAVTSLVQLHLSGRRDTHSILWLLLCLRRWHDRVFRAA